MQGSRAGSTLELVGHEQQATNMSQIDLSAQANSNTNQNYGTQSQNEGATSFQSIKSWPSRFKESLRLKLDEAEAKSDTRAQYVIEVIKAFSGLIIWLVCFVFTIILPVILLFVGLFNLDDCTSSPALPYLVFTIGFVMTTSNLFNLALALNLPILANHRLLASEIKSIIASILNIIFNSLVAFIYILTAYKIFTLNLSNSQQDDVSEANEDGLPSGPLQASSCSLRLYNVTFWFISITLGIFVATSVCGSLLFAYNRYRLAIIRGSAPRSHSRPQTDLPNVNIQTDTSPHLNTGARS